MARQSTCKCRLHHMSKWNTEKVTIMTTMKCRLHHTSKWNTEKVTTTMKFRLTNVGLLVVDHSGVGVGQVPQGWQRSQQFRGMVRVGKHLGSVFKGQIGQINHPQVRTDFHSQRTTAAATAATAAAATAAAVHQQRTHGVGDAATQTMEHGRAIVLELDGKFIIPWLFQNRRFGAVAPNGF
jgi:hypothetical protein